MRKATRGPGRSESPASNRGEARPPRREPAATFDCIVRTRPNVFQGWGLDHATLAEPRFAAGKGRPQSGRGRGPENRSRSSLARFQQGTMPMTKPSVIGKPYPRGDWELRLSPKGAST